MSRVQLALNVTDVDAAVSFYEKVFGTPVNKRRPGYANFAIAEPPLKLVLIENTEGGGTLNHLGVEVESTGEVNAATSRFVEDGLTTFEEQGVECCYAKQDKVWLTDPDGRGWEFYTVLSDSQKMSDSSEEDGCCTTTQEGATACCSA
jgi:catechol 2,3-dioxygenase-like lactoylglutathione lyase family enzyme